MKSAIATKSKDGVYEVKFPDGTKKWFYTREEARYVRDKFNKLLIKETA